MSESEPGLGQLNALGPAEALGELLTCCASPAWAGRVEAGRPYRTLAVLLTEADAALAALAPDELDRALAEHPRIGERSAHPASRREQAALARADSDVLDALAEGNRVYEQRFGHVYLVCAAGRPASELLAVLRERLGNDPETERRVLRAELGKINRLRLSRLVTGR